MNEKANKEVRTKKTFKLPHIYVILVSIMILCAIASWILPAGEFERVPNEKGRLIVVPGTFETIERTPVGPFETVIAIYQGMLNGSVVSFFVFIAYASIGLIISTGAFNGLVVGMLKYLKGNIKIAIIPVFITVLGVISSTIGCFEEFFPFIPIFVGISIAMGYDAIVGLAIVALGAGLGYSGATMNPFTVGTAQGIAGVAPMSAIGFRIFSHASMIVVGSIYTMRYAIKVEKDPTKSYVYGDNFDKIPINSETLTNQTFGIREKLVLLTLLIGTVVIIYGTKDHGWYFGELSAAFLIMGLIASFIMGWSLNTIAEKIAASFSDVAVACMMIGLARGILVVLEEGSIIDTIIYGLAYPLEGLPSWLAAEAMLLVQTLLNFLIPSGSGQAVVSMPIMAPLSDILGVSRQMAIIAFQFGDGLSNIIWPTALTPIVCGIAGVKIEKWWKFMIPVFGMIFVTQMILMAIGVVIGVS